MVWETTYVPITVGIPQSLSPFLQYYCGRYLHPRGITATVIPITAVNTAVLPQSPSPCQSLIIGENLRSKFGHARLLGSRIIHYVRDGRTNRQTNKQKQCSFPFPMVGGITIGQCTVFPKWRILSSPGGTPGQSPPKSETECPG